MTPERIFIAGLCTGVLLSCAVLFVQDIAHALRHTDESFPQGDGN